MSGQGEQSGFWSGALFGMVAGMASLISYPVSERNFA